MQRCLPYILFLFLSPAITDAFLKVPLHGGWNHTLSARFTPQLLFIFEFPCTREQYAALSAAQALPQLNETLRELTGSFFVPKSVSSPHGPTARSLIRPKMTAVAGGKSLQDMISEVKQGGTLVLGSGEYHVEDSLILDKDITIVADDGVPREVTSFIHVSYHKYEENKNQFPGLNMPA